MNSGNLDGVNLHLRRFSGRLDILVLTLPEVVVEYRDVRYPWQQFGNQFQPFPCGFLCAEIDASYISARVAQAIHEASRHGIIVPSHHDDRDGARRIPRGCHDGAAPAAMMSTLSRTSSRSRDGNLSTVPPLER